MKLVINAAIKFLLGFFFVALLLFLPAGSFSYWNAALLLCLLFIPIFSLGLVLLLKAPSLLEKRLNGKEKEGAQKGVVAAAGLIFLCGFVVAGLDFRFAWSQVPLWVVVLASVILLLSYGFYARVMRENAYLSRVVEVREGQKVVSTGLYGVIRHPMYAATLILFLSIPLVLGSLWSLLCFFLYVPVIVIRILNEEKVLLRSLEGYDAYRKKVKYRLIPYIW